MNQITHISLSEDSRHEYSLLLTTFSSAGHASTIVSFRDEATAEAVIADVQFRGGHMVARLYKKKESPNEPKLS